MHHGRQNEQSSDCLNRVAGRRRDLTTYSKNISNLVVSGALARAEAFHVQPFADERFRGNPGNLTRAAKGNDCRMILIKTYYWVGGERRIVTKNVIACKISSG